MKKHILILSLILSLGIGLTAASVIIDNNTEKSTAESHESSEQKYVIKDYNGRIAVYYENSDIPNEIFEIYTKSLPKSDAELIEHGITVSSVDELSKLLEEYTS